MRGHTGLFHQCSCWNAYPGKRRMDPTDKDFILALYGKLWDNLNSRGARLWTLLSIYAAAVGLAFGASQVTNAGLYSSVVIVLFTWWPLFITLNATWLDRQNRLYMDRIEDKFAGILRGVMPTTIQAKAPRFDPTSQIAIGCVAFLIYLRSLWPFLQPGAIATVEQLTLLGVLLLVTLAGPWFWLARTEVLHNGYWNLV